MSENGKRATDNDDAIIVGCVHLLLVAHFHLALDGTQEAGATCHRLCSLGAVDVNGSSLKSCIYYLVTPSKAGGFLERRDESGLGHSRIFGQT
ncbi:hypothetical protein OUZ56_008314 [Daphnia magna]|uniref:Uncharacterized protein n=1 Tax=Daphnia magna TaxID=35525 RepID=A0ABR0AD00_9CRUS|nr:hypothetical protein OUZ56_008314 [Daphnia magna]